MKKWIEDIEIIDEYHLRFLIRLIRSKALSKLPNDWEIKRTIRQLLPSSIASFHNLTINPHPTESGTIQVDLYVLNEQDQQLINQALDGKTVALEKQAYKITTQVMPSKDIAQVQQEWEHYHFKNIPQEEQEDAFLSKEKGQRPDTIVLKELPMKWFDIDISSLKHGQVYQPSEKFQHAMEVFGPVDRMELTNHSTKQKTQRVMPKALHFTAYVQFREYEGFRRAMESLASGKAIRTASSKLIKPLRVTHDKSGYLSEAQVRKRRFIREEATAREERRAREAEKEKERYLVEKEKVLEKRKRLDEELRNMEAKEDAMAFLDEQDIQEYKAMCKKVQSVPESPTNSQLEEYRRILLQVEDSLRSLVEKAESERRVREEEEIERRVSEWSARTKDFQQQCTSRLEELKDEVQSLRDENATVLEHASMVEHVQSFDSLVKQATKVNESMPLITDTTSEEELQQYANKVEVSLDEIEQKIDHLKERYIIAKEIIALDRHAKSLLSRNLDRKIPKACKDILMEAKESLKKEWSSSTEDLASEVKNLESTIKEVEKLVELDAGLIEDEEDIEDIARDCKREDDLKVLESIRQHLVDASVDFLEGLTAKGIEAQQKARSLLQELKASLRSRAKEKREHQVLTNTKTTTPEARHDQAGTPTPLDLYLQSFFNKAEESRKRLREWQQQVLSQDPDMKNRSLTYRKHKKLKLNDRWSNVEEDEVEFVSGVVPASLLLAGKVVQIGPVVISDESMSAEAQLRAKALESKYRSSALASFREKLQQQKTAVVNTLNKIISDHPPDMEELTVLG